jgi:hypothetical protein
MRYLSVIVAAAAFAAAGAAYGQDMGSPAKDTHSKPAQKSDGAKLAVGDKDPPL